MRHYEIHPRYRQPAAPTARCRPVPVRGYLPLKSEDGLTLVQIFTTEEGLIELVQVATRPTVGYSWGPPTTVLRVD